MVVRMQKYQFLVYHRDYESFLTRLRDLGMVHIVAGEVPRGEKLDAFQSRVMGLEKAIRFLKGRKVKPDPVGLDSVDAVLEELTEKRAEYDRNTQHLGQTRKEAALIAPWGEFRPESLDALRNQGLVLRFCTVPAKQYDSSWPEQYPLQVVGESKASLCCIFIGRDEEEPLPPGLEEVRLPERSLHQVEQEIADLEARQQELDNRFDQLAAQAVTGLEAALQQLTTSIEFEKARLAGEALLEERIKVVRGWIPAARCKELDDFLEQQAVYYQRTAAEEGETPPVLLRNSFLVRLFEPIGKLYSLPAYNELDLTPFFAPFFMLFFGFCLGDAGYGALMVAGTVAGLFVAPRKAKPYLWMGFFLGIATIIGGIVTGTGFGVSLPDTGLLPGTVFLLAQKIDFFYFSLAIGIVQVLLALILNIINSMRIQGWQAGMPTIGWLIILAGVACQLGAPHLTLPLVITGYVLFMFFGDTDEDWNLLRGLLFPLIIVGGGWLLLVGEQLGLAVMGGGLLLTALASGSVGKAVLTIFRPVTKAWGLFNDATGLLGDVLSYIRVFALGLSSAILGLVVNSIGLRLTELPVAGPILMVLVLLLGHGLNLALALLAAVVHPMRLTFVEFYKNAGFAGGGKAYKPFALPDEQ